MSIESDAQLRNRAKTFCCEKQSPQIYGGYYFCQLDPGHLGKHQAQSASIAYEDEAWIVENRCPRCGAIHKLVHSMDRCILIDKVKRLQRENAALRKVVEAARAAHGKHPQYVPGFGEHRALGKALAELDAAQEAE